MANNYRTYHDDPYYGFTDEYSYYFDDGLKLNDIPLSDSEDREEYNENDSEEFEFNQDEFPVKKYLSSTDIIIASAAMLVSVGLLILCVLDIELSMQ